MKLIGESLSLAVRSPRLNPAVATKKRGWLAPASLDNPTAPKGQPRKLSGLSCLGLVIHFSAHAAVAAGHRTLLFLLRNLGDQALGGQEQAGNRGGAFQRRARDLLRV